MECCEVQSEILYPGAYSALLDDNHAPKNPHYFVDTFGMDLDRADSGLKYHFVVADEDPPYPSFSRPMYVTVRSEGELADKDSTFP